MKIKKYSRLAGNIWRSNWKRLPHPYKLTFSITDRCNYRCRTCHIWQRKPGAELSLEEIRRFFARCSYFSWIDLTGGEVFLRRDFLGIVETIVTSCRDLLLLHFPTNGYLTDTIVSTVQRILALRPEKLILTVSLDGDAALNDEIRGVPGGWRRQIETFRRLRELRGVRTVLGMTISSLNAGQFESAFQAAKRECPWLTLEDFHINIVHFSPHYYGPTDRALLAGSERAIAETVEGYRGQRKFSRNPVSYLEREYLKRVARYLETGRTPLPCQALGASCFLDASGNVYPCSVFDRRLGNIRDTDYDLLPIWNMERSRELQKEIRNLRCPNCWTPCEAYQTILGSVFRKKNVAR